MDATPEGYPTEWEAECLRIAGDAGLSVSDNFLPPPNSRWRSPDGRSFLELAAFDGRRHLFYEASRPDRCFARRVPAACWPSAP